MERITALEKQMVLPVEFSFFVLSAYPAGSLVLGKKKLW
jgi:hypothetical protein